MLKRKPSSLPHLFVNGKLSSRRGEAGVSFSEGQIFAFESFRCYGRVIFCLREHLDRLFESARTVGLELPKTRAQFEAELKKCLRADPPPDAFLRLAADERNTYVWVLERKRSAWAYQRGVSLKTSVVRRSSVHSTPPEPKTSSFLNPVLAHLETADSEGDESILLDRSGYIAEGTTWNVFSVKSKVLYTPQSGILNGVTRQFVIKLAVAEDLPVFESNLSRHDFWNSDEAFLTNTSGEIVPIHSLDGRRIGREVPGPTTRLLMKRFQKELRKELANA